MSRLRIPALHVSSLEVMGGASLAKLVGQKVLFSYGFLANMVKIGRFNVGKP